MPRVIFDSDHDLFRETARRFIDNEIVPHVPKWEHADKVDKEMFRSAGRAGLLGMAIPEEYGGGERHRRALPRTLRKANQIE